MTWVPLLTRFIDNFEKLKEKKIGCKFASGTDEGISINQSNRDKKDLSGYLTERVATLWLIVAASGVTLRAERDFGGFFGDGRPLLHFLHSFFWADGQPCTV